MKKAIVSGSTGFIGTAFVEYLTQKNIQVLALGRKDWAKIDLRKKIKLQNATYAKIKMEEIAHIEKIITKSNWEVGDSCVFFNLAWGGDKDLSDLDVEAQFCNVDQAVCALEVSKQIGCNLFVHIGTMEEAFTQKYLELDHNVDTQYNRHVIYSLAKMAAKQALEVRASQIGMNLIYTLHSHVMGELDDKDSFLQVTLKKILCGEDLIFSSGEQYFDVISVEDCSLGYYLIGKKGKPGKTYWVGSGDPRRLKEYVERMYALYPSNKKMEFGKLKYNDIVLDKEEFAIKLLVEDTGYQPKMTYEETVIALKTHLDNMM